MDQNRIDALGKAIAEGARKQEMTTNDAAQTPRTDAHRLTPAARTAPKDVVDADFARRLERELSALREQLAVAQKCHDEEVGKRIAAMQRAERAEAEVREIRKDVEKLNKLVWLAAQDIVFFGTWNEKAQDWDDGHYPYICTNDIFVAAADGDSISMDDVEVVYEMEKSFPQCGAFVWCSIKKRNWQKPRREFPEWEHAVAYLKTIDAAKGVK